MAEGHTVRAILLIITTALAAGGQVQFSGIVKNSITGLPDAKATVRLVPIAGRVGYVRTSGASGEFRFEQISPGDYRLGMERRGFSTAAHAALKGVPGGSVIHLTAGQNLADLDVMATPLPIVSGTVTEGPGEGAPVPRAIVEVLAQRWSIAGRWFEEVDDVATNDLGEFRAAELEPGRYYFYATRPEEGALSEIVKDASGKGELCLAGAYYPNASAIESASPVEVRAGQEVTGIALHLAWSPCFHVRGQAGQDVNAVQVIRRGQDTPLSWETHAADREKDGTFDVRGVPSGDYLVSAVVPLGRRGSAEAVTVESHDLEGLVVAGENIPFRARIQVEGDGAPPLTTMFLRLETVTGPGNSTVHRVAVQPDGTARLDRIAPERYTLTAGSSPGGVYVKSVKAGAEALQSPVLDYRRGSPPELEILLGLGTGRVQGTLQWPDSSQGGVPVPTGDALVAVLVPQVARPGTRGAWFADLDQNGAFTFSEIPPGKYTAFVAANLEEGLWTNREFVGLVQGGGVPVELPEKGSVQVQVSVLPLPMAQRAMESLR